MFVDLVEIEVRAGKGGNGLVSFRREKFINRGGPNGGDGGPGGSIIFKADTNQSSLAKFRHHPLIIAADGQAGGPQNQRGRSAEDVIVNVPVGTCLTDVGTQDLLADLSQADQEVTIAQGGEGGFGNAHFKTSRRQTPLLAEKGLPGQQRRLQCELKLVADVGIIGLPNAGKSTFLSVVSQAQPAIADYPFTTLTPNLGVAYSGDQSLLLADIPGLIEGAASGKGLGHKFLRHAERNRLLLHLIDAYQKQPAEAYQTIRQEISNYSSSLAKLPEVVALTKIESLTAGHTQRLLAELKKVVPAKTPIMAISASAHLNLEPLLQTLIKQLQIAAAKKPTPKPVVRAVFGLSAADQADWQVTKKTNKYLVTGKKIERFAHKTHFDDQHSLDRLQAIMLKLGISHELVRRGYDGSQAVVFGRPAIGRLEPTGD